MSSSAIGRAVHARRVELNDAVLVRQSAEPHRLVIGIELLDVDPGENCVESVSAIPDDHVVGALHAADSVARRNDDWSRRTGAHANE